MLIVLVFSLAAFLINLGVINYTTISNCSDTWWDIGSLITIIVSNAVIIPLIIICVYGIVKFV